MLTKSDPKAKRSSGYGWIYFLEAHRTAPKQIILDLDATDDPLHGHQEGRLFHSFHAGYCYLPAHCLHLPRRTVVLLHEATPREHSIRAAVTHELMERIVAQPANAGVR